MSKAAVFFVLISLPPYALAGESSEISDLKYCIQKGEDLESYAARLGIPSKQTLSVSSEDNIEFVLVPAGEYPIGLTPPSPPESYLLDSTSLLSLFIGFSLLGMLALAFPVIRFGRGPGTGVFKNYRMSLRRLTAAFLFFSLALFGLVNLYLGHYRENSLLRQKRYNELYNIYRDAPANEKPGQKILIPRPFYISTREISQYEFENIMGYNKSLQKGGIYPVNEVSWFEAVEFCCRASARFSANVRLPREVEWEAACRGELPWINREVFYGSDYVDKNAWCLENSGYLVSDPVGCLQMCGRKEANGFGIFDMCGNVYEWCDDWYSDEWYVSSIQDKSIAPSSIRKKVIRGGAFCVPGALCRPTSRLGHPPSIGKSFIGIRACLEVVLPQE